MALKIKLPKEFKEILRYLIVGILTTVISLGTYFFCVMTFLNPNNGVQLQIANIISWVLAVFFAYIANRKFVFHSKQGNLAKEIISFFSSRVATLLLDMGVMLILVTFIGIDDKVAKILVQFIIVIANYILSKFFVFNEYINLRK